MCVCFFHSFSIFLNSLILINTKRYGKPLKDLDLSLTIRFANLPNNAKLILVIFFGILKRNFSSRFFFFLCEKNFFNLKIYFYFLIF